MAGSGAEGLAWPAPIGTLGRRGASLAELLVALTILGIGMAATAGTLTLASRAMGHAEVAFRAALVAAEVLGESAPGPGSRETDAGLFRWSPVPGPGLEVRFEPGEGAASERLWQLGPDALGPEEPPWWSFWWP
jgi:prepilin-type N-terminal cleavage/methylation domain-containing protein